MNQNVVALVQSSWAKVLPIAGTAGNLFYANLFEADPTLRRLFKGNMEQQAGKLMHMINAAVRKLDDPATLIPILQQLGTRHTGYGVVPSHYATVGAALLKTLEQGLGPAFTPEVKSAWSTVYGFIANVMMKQSAAETASETAQASLPERRSIPRAHSVAAV